MKKYVYFEIENNEHFFDINFTIKNMENLHTNLCLHFYKIR